MRRIVCSMVLLMFASTDVLAENVLIFGGTGQLGAPHVRFLAERGDRVAVFHRATSSFARLEGLDFQKIEGDLMDASTVLAAMRSARPDVVIDASARRGAAMNEERTFYAPIMRHIIDAARQTGVEQIILHGSIGVRGSEAYLRDELGYTTGSSNMQDKAEAERVLERSGIRFTIIRNGLLDFEPAAATGNATLTEDQNTFGRITRTDLAGVAVQCIAKKKCYDRIFHAIDPSLVGPRPPRESE